MRTPRCYRCCWRNLFIQRRLIAWFLKAWVLLPLGIVAWEWAAPSWRASCEKGFSNFSLVLLIVVGLHHLYSENCAYTALTSLLSQPEMVIMRHFGVVRRRKYLVAVGICEAFLLFTDVTFPFVARECDDILTENWKTAWRDVPMVGDFAVKMLSKLRFWGFALLSSATGILVNGVACQKSPQASWTWLSCRCLRWHLFNSMMFNVTFQVLHLWTEVLGLLCMPFLRSRVDSVSGTDFVAWARAAETSMMPSFFDRTCLFKNNQGIIKGVGLSQKASNLETQKYHVSRLFRVMFQFQHLSIELMAEWHCILNVSGVALLAEEMANQKRYVVDNFVDYKDNPTARQARSDFIYGRLDADTATMFEEHRIASCDIVCLSWNRADTVGEDGQADQVYTICYTMLCYTILYLHYTCTSLYILVHTCLIHTYTTYILGISWNGMEWLLGRHFATTLISHESCLVDVP